MNVNLFKVGCVRLQHFDECEPDGSITREGNPETTLTLGISQRLLTLGLVENRLRGMAPQKLSGREFYSPELVQIVRSGEDDLIRRHKWGGATLSRSNQSRRKLRSQAVETKRYINAAAAHQSQSN
jgi:hypothetical protein